MRFRFLHLGLAALIVVAGIAGCVSSPDGDASTTKVLIIGNSFSISLLEHLPKVAADRGVALDLASLYLGGSSLDGHWSNATNAVARPYRYDRIVRGKRVFTNARRNVCATLRDTKWDIVTIQQVSHESWRPETYHPCGDQLVEKIRELAPQARIFVHETWSYTPWDKRLAEWGIDSKTMYEKLHASYGAFADEHELEVIHFGTAVEEWRRRLPVRYTEKSFGGDVVGGGRQDDVDQFKRNVRNEWEPNCDVFHLNPKGAYFQALVWAVSLFEVDLDDMETKPDYVTDDEAKLMREIAADLE